MSRWSYECKSFLPLNIGMNGLRSEAHDSGQASKSNILVVWKVVTRSLGILSMWIYVYQFQYLGRLTVMAPLTHSSNNFAYFESDAIIFPWNKLNLYKMTNKLMFLIIVINFLKKLDFAWMNLNHGTNILTFLFIAGHLGMELRSIF